MSSVRWLLVGAGDISAKRVAPALAAAEDAEIVAILDTNETAARSLADRYDVRTTYADLDAALADSGADAVYLATPVGIHAVQAIESLEAGKCVIVEKPLGVTGEEAVRIVDAARNSRGYASCAYFRRFSPRYEHARQLLQAGELGQIVSVRMAYSSWFNPAADDPKHWRVTRSRSGGGPLADMGTHMFDVLIGLFGMPVSVFARCGNLTSGWDVEDSAAAVMTLADGALVTASFNWNSKSWRHEFEIVGTEGRLNWSPYDTGPVVKILGRDACSLDLPPAENVHRPLIDDFTEAVRDGRSPRYTVEESARASVLLDAVYLSAAQGREVIL